MSEVLNSCEGDMPFILETHDGNPNGELGSRLGTVKFTSLPEAENYLREMGDPISRTFLFSEGKLLAAWIFGLREKEEQAKLFLLGRDYEYHGPWECFYEGYALLRMIKVDVLKHGLKGTVSIGEKYARNVFKHGGATSCAVAIDANGVVAAWERGLGACGATRLVAKSPRPLPKPL